MNNFNFKICKNHFLSFVFRYHTKHAYVPSHKQVTNADIDIFESFIATHSRILVLTGAGISTESGIPDYRSELVGLYARSGHKPIQHQDFVRKESIRQRYWARNYLAWSQFSSFEPNISHHYLTHLEKMSKMRCCVTQNVDRLHHKAGTQRIVELHGSAYTVKCLNCKYTVSRFLFQQLLTELNEHMVYNTCVSDNATHIRPDGDIDIDSDYVKQFRYPYCPRCNGILKPDIVFFGDNVPKHRVDEVYENLQNCDSLLVIGSSLHVYSGFRFALSAHESGKHIAVINIGPTRIDNFDNIIKLNARAGDILSKVFSKP